MKRAGVRASAAEHPFLAGGGEMGALMRSRDWSQSPLGAPEDWPAALKSTVAMMLPADVQIVLFWGSEFVALYNDAYASTIGGKHPRAVGRPARENWAELWDDLEPLLGKVRETGETVSAKDRPFYIERHGYPETVYFDISYSAIRDEDGAVAGVLCLVNETTGRVLAETALRESEARQRTIIETTPECVKIVAPDGVLVHMNPAGLRMVEAESSDQVVGGNIYDIIAPEHHDEWRAWHERVCAGESLSWEFDTIGFDGTRRRMETHAAPLPLPDGRIGQLAVTRDVTERKTAEDTLRESELRFRRIADSAPTPMWVTGLDRRREFVNRAYVEFLDLSYEKAVEFDWREIIHPDDHDRIVAESVAGEASLETFALEGRYRRHDGAWRWLRTVSQPRFGADGEPNGFIGVGHDVTALKEAEAALRESEERQTFLLKLSDALRPITDPAEIQSTTSRLISEHVGASRANYLEVEGEGDAAEGFIRGQFVRDGAPFPERFPYSAFAGAFADEALRSGKALIVSDTARDPRIDDDVRRIWLDESVGAVVAIALVKEGRFAGIFGVHHASARDWSPDEIALIEEVAERTWAAAERARAEQALRESDERLREKAAEFEALAENVSQLAWMAEPDGSIFWYNRRWYEYTGTDLHSMKDWGWRDVHHPDHVDAVIEEVRGNWAAGEAWEGTYLLRSANGEYRWFLTRAEPIRNKAGELVRWFGTNTDIHAQIEAEAALLAAHQAAEAKAAERSAILGQLAEGVIVTDAAGRIVFVNAAAKALHGVEALDVEPSEYSDTYHLFREDGTPHPFEEMPLTRAVMKGETVIDARWRIRRPDGTDVLAIGGAQPIRDADGAQLGSVLTVRDDTRRYMAEQALRDLNETLEQRVEERTAELVRAQEALRQSQKLEAIGQLTGGVAHDFNNLLTPIVGSLDLLQRRGIGCPREQRLIEGAAQSADRARTLVQRLLAFARRQPLKTEAVDVAALVGGMGELVASTTGPQIKVVVDAPDDLPAAKADPNQLEMAILNLSVNARDAMPDGGTLRITAEAEAVQDGHRSKLPPGAYVRLSIADTGSGMDAAVLARAVEPFFSTKGIGKGTGLGLSMVHGLASQLGGALSISSRPGLGTNVELWLPAAPRPAKSVGAEAQPPPMRATAGTALLVDDEDLVRASTADMLADLGYHVAEAASAEEALRLLDEGVTPSLVVTDHLMPGMTGTDLAYAVRDRRPGTPVLIVSGYAESQGIASDLPRLTKPFRQSELACGIAEATGG